ncbi:MAG: RHS repeat domain-containing protein [Pirellula sp.]
MSIHSQLPYDQSTSHARIPAGGINLIASIDSVSEAQFTASFFGSTKALHGEVATTSPETTTHNHSNQQYSVTAITTSSGAIAERYAYSAYGEPTILDSSGNVITSSSINNRYSYTGREWDSTVGLHHFRARWMSSKTGRFITRDPIGFVGSEWDLYEFVGGHALNAVDPSGMLIPPTPPVPVVGTPHVLVFAGGFAVGYSVGHPLWNWVYGPKVWNPTLQPRPIPVPKPLPKPDPKPVQDPEDEKTDPPKTDPPKDNNPDHWCRYTPCGDSFIQVGQFVTHNCSLSFSESLTISYADSDRVKCEGWCKFECNAPNVSWEPTPVRPGVDQGIVTFPGVSVSGKCTRTKLSPN